MMCCFSCFFFYVGLVYVLNLLYTGLKLSFVYFFPIAKQDNWLQKYGQDSYALITGCTSGIGLKWVQMLAERGFNLVLWSRSATKLEKLQNSLSAQYPESDFRVIAKDFTDCHQSEFFESALEPVKDLDISILVNNVGVTFPKVDFAEADPQLIVDNININMIPQTVLNSIMIPKFETRAGQSAIIDLASTAACGPFPLAKIYGSTKHFNRYLTFGLNSYFSSDKLTFLSVNPGPISTGMMEDLSDNLYKKISNTLNTLFNSMIVDTHQCVYGSMRSLGKHLWTGGAIMHTWLYLGLETLATFSLLQDFGIWGVRAIRKMVKK